MVRLADLVAERNKKKNATNSGSTEGLYPASTAYQAKTTRLADLVAERRNRGVSGTSRKSDSPTAGRITDAQNWQNGANGLLQEWQNYSQNWGDEQTHYDYGRRIQAYIDQFDDVYAGLEGNSNARDSVSYTQLALKRALKNVPDVAGMWSQFGSQEEYDNSIQWQDDVANMDLGAAWGDLDTLKQEKEDFMNMSSEELAAYVEENKENLPGYVEGFWYNPDEIVRDYSTRIAEQTAYLNSIEAARRISDFELATEDANFARESAYMGTMPQPMGTTKSEARRFYEYINDPSVRAEQDKAWAQANPYGDSPYSSDALNSMTEQEKAVFNYYFNTQGEDAAMAYLDAILSTLRQRKGAEKAAELKDRTLAEFAFAVPAGLDQFSSGLAGLFSNEEQTPDWRQYASAEVREDLGDVRIFQNSNAKNSFGQAVYDTTTSLSNMAPSIIASTLVGFVNPVAGSVVGAGLMGTSAAGNAYQEMLSAGYDMKQARTYGVMVGASEALLSSLLGGISKLGGALPNGITNALLQNIDNAVARVALTIGTNVASEFTEEALQEMLTPYFQNLILNTNHNLNDFTADALYAGMLGAITAGIMEGPSTIGSAVQTRNTGKSFLGSTATLEDLKVLAGLMPDNAEVQDLASRVNEKSNAYTVGRFYEAVENGMPAQYRADVEASRSRVYNELVDAGVTTKDANAIANVAESLMLGKNISKAQETTLNRLREELPGIDEAISNGIHSREMVSARLRSGVSDAVRGKFNIKKSTETATEAATADNQQTAPVTRTTPQTASQVNRKATYNTVESIAEEYDVSPSAIYQVAEQSSNQVDEKAFAEGMRAVLAFTQETNLTRDKAAAALQKTGMVSALSPQQIALAVELGWDLRDVVASEKQRAYDMGLAGQDIGDVLDSKTLSHLTEAQRREAFNEGAKVAKEAKASGEKVLPKTASMAYRKGSVRFDGDAKAISSKFKLTQKSAYIILERIAQLTGMDIVLFASKTDEYGNFIGVQGEFAQDNPNEIRIDVNAGLNNVNDMSGLANYVMLRTFTHEFVHSLEVNAKAEYRALKEAVFAEIRKNGKWNVEDLILAQQELGGKNEDGSYKLSYDDASHEVLAQSLVDVLPQSTFIETLATQHRNIFDKLYAALKRFMRTIRHRFEQMTSAIPSEAAALKRDVDGAMQYAQHIVDLFDKAALAAVETVQNRGAEGTAVRVAANADVQLDPSTASSAPIRNSLRTWTESEYVYARDAAAKVLAKQLNITEKQATTYIDNINGIAALIADDKVRLDYEPNMDIGATVLKPNSEYKFTVDMSTLCSKRLLFTGTFDAIQKALPNTVFDSDDIVNLRKMMVDRGLEVACGICYVESTRREIGRITQDFIERYKLAQKTGNPITRLNSEGKEVVLKSEGRTFAADPNYTPNLGDLNTTDIDLVKRDHREVYDAYLAFMNARGQAKPKLLETRAEYKGEILRSFKAKSAVNARNAHGGLRLQSFSDFEVPHMIDMMQVIMDMSRVGLKSQAYTKVPAFAEVFGGTGVKINLSLIAKGDGVDANGNLIFDDVEGMNHEDAFRIREMYSENVGTILVGKNDNHIIKAMADPRIDFIIPFHKSSWKESLYDALGLRGYDDYTDTQNEKPIDPARGKLANFDPSEYWDFTKTGDENAQIYLQKCREDGRIPKFPKFQGYPGYWKLLIDFKMYDNEGNGAPQQIVKPEYNMEAATRILNEYKGGHRSFPVAQDVVDEFVEAHRQKNENPTGKVRYQARPSAKDPSKLDPRTVTREDVEELLNNANAGNYLDRTYVPVRISTPGIVQERLKVENLPMVMPVAKIKQAMRADAGPQKGSNVRGHGFSASDIADIMEAMDSPRFVFSQPDGRGAVVIRTKRHGDSTAILVEFGDHINQEYTNGYEGGEYNVTVTTFNVDNGDLGLLAHAMKHGWSVVFDKKKEGNPAKKFPATRPFAIEQDTLNDTISPPDPSVNPSRSQRRENLTDRSVLERADEIVGAVSDGGTVTGDTHGLDVDEVTAFKDKLTEGERYLLNIYAERLAKLNDLQEQRREQGRLYRRFMADENPANRDKAAAAATKNRMDILDQQIEKAMDSLREAERAKGYKSLLTKSRELVEQTERGRIKTALQLSREKRERSGQRRQRKESIIRSAEELESMLNKGNKKRNVKKDMQGLAAGVADLYNVLFNEEMNSPKYSKLFNERIVRNGFGVILSTKETTHAEEAKNILAKMERGRTQELENQLAYRMGQLHDALERERERINSINAGDVFQRIADEYKSLQTSGYDYIRGAFSEDAYNHLLQLKDKVGTTAARDMTLSQLIDLDNAYRVVLTTIRNANKLFIDGQKQTVQQAGNRVIIEVGRNARKSKAMTNPGKVVATFTWNNEKPIYAFERIGSDTLTNLFWNIRNGEDVWIVDVEEAKAYREEQAKKYGYDTWDAKKRYEFESTDGAKFSLTLEQLMSLYAYSKREQATEHLLKGGVVLAGAEVIVNGKRLVNDDATAYAIPADTLAKIGESLTADQRGYVDAMQDYLSKEMARKGNEISMQLYGIELFGEKNYFPINSSGIYNEKAEQQFRQKESGQISIVNSGFTKSTAPKASNPVRLSGFSDVWASHVNEMSMYHAFVLPLEDFRRVRNFQTTTENGTKGDGVISAIQNAQGSAAVKYINQLLEDLNGGAVSDDRESGLKKLTSKFKKAATMASLSVVVQQISSLPRAWAMIDAKYFAGKVNKQKYSATLAEMRKYAPVMMIKEMGHFDTGMGRSATEYINSREYTGKKRFGAFFKDSGYRDEILGKAPAKVDEIAWMQIWKACKNETHAKHPNMSVTSEAFLKAAGKRFTEVIVKTQVYDSTLTKSANMRSKSALMGMVTSFLAEPTVTANMFFNALRSKDSKTIARTVGALVVSAIANNLLSSIVYAMRDDDEDETYWEKYLQAFTTGMADSLNPLTWLPFLRDVWSILQGFDVQRADMSLIADVADSVKSFVRTSASWSDDMTDEEVKEYWKEFGKASANIVLTVSNVFGIPLKNIAREAEAAFNTFKTATDDVHGNGRKMGEKIWDDIRASTPILGWIPKTESKTDRLYEAIVIGDTGYQERAQLTYASEKPYENAVRKALRENDPRIEAAARARMSGDLTEYVRLFREIQNEGHFEFDTIMAAVNSAENALTPDEESTASESPQTLFTIGNYYTALVSGDETSAQLAYDELYQQKLAEGYLEDEARSSVESSLAAQIGQAYRDKEIGRDQALRLLTENTEGHGEYDIKKWDFQIEYKFSWGSRERAYRTGAINRDKLIEAYMDIEGVSRAEAVAYVDELDFESREGFDYSDISAEQKAGNINMDEATQMYIQAGFTPEEAEEKAFTIDFIRRNPEAPDITYSAISNYTEHCEPVSISVSTYYDAWKFYNSAESNKDANGDVIEGESKRDKVVDYIDSLPLDAGQKHALWLSLGYSAKTSEWR